MRGKVRIGLQMTVNYFYHFAAKGMFWSYHIYHNSTKEKIFKPKNAKFSLFSKDLMMTLSTKKISNFSLNIQKEMKYCIGDKTRTLFTLIIMIHITLMN